MDLKKIAGLVKIIEESSFKEFSYEDEAVKIKMSKLDHPPVVAAGVPAAPMAAPMPMAAAPAAETDAEVILLAKTIDGVYSADPKVDSTAVKYDAISYKDVLAQDLKVMDSTATALCKDNNIPLQVFAISDPENIVRVIKGEKIGTIVS